MVVAEFWSCPRRLSGGRALLPSPLRAGDELGAFLGDGKGRP